MTKPYLLSYRKGSKSINALAKGLGCWRINVHKNTFIHRKYRLVINWGNNSVEKIHTTLIPGSPSLNCGITNGQLNVVSATNKLGFFNSMKEAMPDCIPEYTESREEAKAWVSDGDTVVVRKLLNASSGKGIQIADSCEEVVPAPLYVKYIKKQDEYRVHVFAGEVIDVQRKMRSTDVADEDVNWQVRNHDNGFIFGRDGIEPPAGIEEMCKKCITSLGLDIGAVDVIYNKKADKMYILEVNTAPGLTGTTLEKYAAAISKYCGEYKRNPLGVGL